jgi:disulfide bond formation protein DsbB
MNRVSTLLQPSAAIALVTVGSAALLAGAWWFQLVLGLLPCKLCLEQRWPHYAGLVVGAVALACGLAGIGGRTLARGALWLLALIFAVSLAMGAYHAGVEWGLFEGPSDCGGAGPAAAGSMQDFMKQLQTTRVVSCTEAAWRWLGLSLAGWNAVFSAALAVFAAFAAMAAGQSGPQGSSSLSQ